MMYRLIYKRILDIVLAGILLIIFSPFLIIVYILLFVFNNGNPIFSQIRPGYKGMPFTMFKFKTMHDRVDERGDLLPDEERITKIGKIVRLLSIDELLQLINVLKGDMSLVGPRPLLIKYLDLYTQDQFKRHNVKPGITGLAQVNGRNSITWEEKFKWDLEYVDRISLILDLKILLITIINVFQRKGINSNGRGTMEEFKGSIENKQ
jgi:undecaprenyl phosphate N,N'-diacetylbacillosamine 1-phosphate transferase